VGEAGRRGRGRPDTTIRPKQATSLAQGVRRSCLHFLVFLEVRAGSNIQANLHTHIGRARRPSLDLCRREGEACFVPLSTDFWHLATSSKVPPDRHPLAPLEAPSWPRRRRLGICRSTSDQALKTFDHGQLTTLADGSQNYERPERCRLGRLRPDRIRSIHALKTECYERSMERISHRLSVVGV
jgi:hypothetical protein